MPDRVGTTVPWRAESAWEAVAPPFGRSGNPEGSPGVVLRPLPVVDMVTLIARRDRRAAFDAVVTAHWGDVAPGAGRVRQGAGGALVWSAPDQWLAVGGPAAEPDALARAFADVAAISAQGDGRALIEVDGPDARRALAKLIAVDLHPDVFTPGSAAVAAFDHLPVQFWQRPEATAVTLCVARTVAGSIWAALLAAAAAYGCEALDR